MYEVKSFKLSACNCESGTLYSCAVFLGRSHQSVTLEKSRELKIPGDTAPYLETSCCQVIL